MGTETGTTALLHARASSAYPWIIVGLLFVVAVLNYLDRLMITTMVEPIQGEFVISSAQVALFTSVFLWVYAAVSPFGGFLADRFGRRWVILGSLFFWSAATCLSGFAHSYRELLTARALMGISEACYMPAALAIIADYHRGRTRSLATGFHMAGIYCGAALGGLGGYVAASFGWRLGFKVFGAFGIAYAVLIFFTLRDRSMESFIASPSGQGRGVGGDSAGEGTGGAGLHISEMLAALVRSNGFLILFVVNILVGTFNWTIYAWLPTYLKERFQLGLGAAGMSATFYIQAGSFAGVLLAGALADWWRRSNPRARALVPAIGFCIGGPCLILAGSTPLLWIVIVAFVVVGLSRGAFDANHMPMLRELIDERYSATAFGVLNFISVAAGGVMVYVGGAMKDAHVDLSLVFQASGAAMLAAGVLLWMGVGFPQPERT